jgi:hypothetical protein
MVKVKVLTIIVLFGVCFVVPLLRCEKPLQTVDENKDKVRITIIGPKVLATSEEFGETATYKIRITGGPAEYTNMSRNWSYKAYLEGENTTGASPVLGSEATGNSETSGNFTLNVTAPTNIEQTVTLVVNGTSSAGNESVSAVERYKITVVKPVILTFEIYNKGEVDVQNITVVFYVDGERIGDKMISSLSANSSTNVSINWTIEKYEVGRHLAKAEIIPESGLIVFKNNKNVITKEFYIIPEKMDPKWFYVATILFVIISIVFGYALFRKRPPRMR